MCKQIFVIYKQIADKCKQTANKCKQIDENVNKLLLFTILGLDEDQGGLAQLPDGRVTCLRCCKTLSTVASGRRHYAAHHQPNQPERCRLCKKMCKNRQSLHQHLRQIHGVTTKMMQNVIPPPAIQSKPSSMSEYSM